MSETVLPGVTPGDWTLETDEADAGIVVNDDGWQVCQMAANAGGDWRANGALVVAAKALYAACRKSQEAEAHFRSCDFCDQDNGELCEVAIALHGEAETLCVAAIAKAEGRAA